MELTDKLKLYYITAILSLVFAVIGFSYNAWRLEVTEENSNIRTASFEMLTNLAELEQLIYIAHYDKNPIDGSPRKGWIKVGLIVDLSILINPSTENKSTDLKSFWESNWNKIDSDREAVNKLVSKIDNVRASVKLQLNNLK